MLDWIGCLWIYVAFFPKLRENVIFQIVTLGTSLGRTLLYIFRCHGNKLYMLPWKGADIEISITI